MGIRSIVLKMGIYIFVSFVVLLVPLSYVFFQMFSNLFGDSVVQDLETKGNRYAFLIAQFRDENQVLKSGEDLAKISKEGIRIINHKGEIILNSEIPTDLNLKDNEIGSLLDGKPVKKLEFRPFYSLNGIWVGIPVQHPGTDVAAIILYDNAKLLSYAKQKLLYVFLLAVLGTILMATGITTFLSYRLGQPLVEISQLIRSISGSQLKPIKKKNIQGNDEIAYIFHAINDLSEELFRYYSTRNDLLANISHEIRTPLTYIQGYSAALKQGLYKDEKTMQEYLTIIETENQRILKIVSDLINITKIENGQFPFYKRNSDLKQLIASTINSLWPRITEKKIKLDTFYPARPVYAWIDPDRMTQVLFNLIDNAIRYTQENGQVIVALRETTDWVEIRIKDTGIGIAEEELSLIWERFYRAEKSRDRLYGGVGLGLSIVKQLVEMHGGQITVSSMPGSGTEFVVTIPKNSRLVSDDKEEQTW